MVLTEVIIRKTAVTSVAVVVKIMEAYTAFIGDQIRSDIGPQANVL